MRNYVQRAKEVAGNTVAKVAARKHEGIDGILVTVGLCIVALVVCVVFKDQMSTFVSTMMTDMTTKASNILSGSL